MSAVDSVFNNQTLTTNGSYVFRAGSAAQATFAYNITGAISGTVTFTIAEVDPNDETTVIGVSKSSAAIGSTGAGTLTITLFNSTTVKVSWVVSGGGSIAGTSAAIFWKDTNGLQAVTFGGPGGAATISTTVDLHYDQSIAATVANQWQRVIGYTVPTLYTASVLKYTSWQNDVSFSRLECVTVLGSHNLNTNTFTGGSSYTFPTFAPVVQAMVTTAIGAGAGNVTYTVTYTNQDGTAGRTGTITIPRGSVANTQWVMSLQAGDLGVRSIQAVSGTPNGIAGVIDLNGLVVIGEHTDRDSTAQTETVFSPGVVTLPAGTFISVSFNGSATSKQRIFDVLLQLNK